VLIGMLKKGKNSSAAFDKQMHSISFARNASSHEQRRRPAALG
jgi:hypothetical protein